VLACAFLAVWIPYQAAVGLQERFEFGGPLGPTLMAMSLLVAFLASWWLARRSLPDPFGLSFDRSTLPIILAGLLLATACRFAAGALAVASGIATDDAAGTAGSLLGSFSMALAIGAIPALAEDILTRGFPLFAARGARPAWLLVSISALMFMLNHVWRFDWGVTEQVRLFCMGIAYALAAWRLNSLWAAFGLHLGWNGGAALVPLDISGTDAFRLETAAIHLLIAGLLLAIPKRRRDS
jgi:membrane protease YdiL (CAAX protease family)